MTGLNCVGNKHSRGLANGSGPTVCDKSVNINNIEGEMCEVPGASPLLITPLAIVEGPQGGVGPQVGEPSTEPQESPEPEWHDVPQSSVEPQDCAGPQWDEPKDCAEPEWQEGSEECEESEECEGPEWYDGLEDFEGPDAYDKPQLCMAPRGCMEHQWHNVPQLCTEPEGCTGPIIFASMRMRPKSAASLERMFKNLEREGVEEQEARKANVFAMKRMLEQQKRMHKASGHLKSNLDTLVQMRTAHGSKRDRLAEIRAAQEVILARKKAEREEKQGLASDQVEDLFMTVPEEGKIWMRMWNAIKTCCKGGEREEGEGVYSCEGK